MSGHFRLCVAAVGCNLRCRCCRSRQLSQRGVEDVEFFAELDPQRIVDLALQNGAQSICFTFSEAISFCEDMYYTAVIEKKTG
jgi:pyruvate formate lyase activating enzyme